MPGMVMVPPVPAMVAPVGVLLKMEVVITEWASPS
jgi:hypothetical protein